LYRLGFFGEEMKKVFFLLGVIALSLGIGKSWHWAKDGFSVPRIQGWEGVDSYPPLEQEAIAALQQPYRYLGRGRQCFAFVSADGQYVLKFPRLDRYRIPFWLRALNVSVLDRMRFDLSESHAFRETMILNSFRMSWDELRGATALIAIHMPEAISSDNQLTLIDRLGRKVELPLEKTAFILQKKEEPLLRALKAALKQGDEQKAEEILSAFLAIAQEWGRKGIFNKDPKFIRDLGLDKARAYQIDIGSFYRKEGILDFSEVIREPVQHMREWLVREAPQLTDRYDKKAIALSPF